MNLKQITPIAVMVALLVGFGFVNGKNIAKSIGETKMQAPPLCQTSTDMKHLDGQVVRLVGIYRKRLVHKKKPSRWDNSPPIFMGHIVIEVQGSAMEYDPYQMPEARSIVRLGLEPRPSEEIERFIDKKVLVEGKLMVDVSSLAPPADIAQVAEPPVLMEFQDIAEY